MLASVGAPFLPRNQVRVGARFCVPHGPSAPADCPFGLVPWEDLPEEERKKNTAFIRQLPSLLARAGFQIDRAEGREGRP
jgi:hypothetical protein